jgi:hypothetical protein
MPHQLHGGMSWPRWAVVPTGERLERVKNPTGPSGITNAQPQQRHCRARHLVSHVDEPPAPGQYQRTLCTLIFSFFCSPPSIHPYTPLFPCFNCCIQKQRPASGIPTRHISSERRPADQPSPSRRRATPADDHQPRRTPLLRLKSPISPPSHSCSANRSPCPKNTYVCPLRIPGASRDLNTLLRHIASRPVWLDNEQ